MSRAPGVSLSDNIFTFSAHGHGGRGLFLRLAQLKGTKHDYPELGETSHRMEMEIYNDDDDDDDDMSVCSTSSSSDDDDDND